MREPKHMALESHVQQVRQHGLVDPAALEPKGMRVAGVERLGLDLDEIDLVADLSENVDANQERPVGNGCLVQRDGVRLQQLRRLRQGVCVARGRDLHTARMHHLCQLAHLEPTLGQRGQELVVKLCVGVVLLARVVQLGRALDGERESGLGEVAGRGHGKSVSSAESPIDGQVQGLRAETLSLANDPFNFSASVNPQRLTK